MYPVEFKDTYLLRQIPPHNFKCSSHKRDPAASQRLSHLLSCLENIRRNFLMQSPLHYLSCSNHVPEPAVSQQRFQLLACQVDTRSNHRH